MRKARIGLCILLPIISFLAASFLIINQKYLSTAKARVELSEIDVSSTGLAQLSGRHPSAFNRLAPIDLAERLVSHGSVGGSLESLGFAESSEATEGHRKRLRARVLPGTNIIEIVYQHEDKEFAVDFINTLIENENDRRLDIRIDLVGRLRNSLRTIAQDHSDRLITATGSLIPNQGSTIAASPPPYTGSSLQIEVFKAELKRIDERLSELEVYQNSLVPQLSVIDSPRITAMTENSFRVACIILSGFGCLFVVISLMLITEKGFAKRVV